MKNETTLRTYLKKEIPDLRFASSGMTLSGMSFVRNDLNEKCFISYDESGKAPLRITQRVCCSIYATKELVILLK